MIDPEIERLREAMVAAIEAYVRADELIADEDFLTDVVIVGAALPPEPDDNDGAHSRIFTVATSSSMPAYIFRGLLYTGIQSLDANTRIE